MRPKLTILFLSLLLLSGCFQLEVNQTLHRDGTVDLTILIDSGSVLTRDIIEKQIGIHPSLEETVTRVISNDEVTYTIEGAALSDGVLFMVGNESQSVQFLDRDTFSVKRSLKFPFHYYTAEIDLRQNTDGWYGGNLISSIFTGGAVDLTYTLEVFGDIVETDGEQIDDQTVRFSKVSNEVVRVTFREFFWAGWFS